MSTFRIDHRERTVCAEDYRRAAADAAAGGRFHAASQYVELYGRALGDEVEIEVDVMFEDEPPTTRSATRDAVSKAGGGAR